MRALVMYATSKTPTLKKFACFTLALFLLPPELGRQKWRWPSFGRDPTVMGVVEQQGERNLGP